MDWIEGTDLEALLDREGSTRARPPLDDRLPRAGRRGPRAPARARPPVVHGDVKPANLILTSSGRIVVVDFGLSSTPTDELRRAGTPGYVAPEVAAGERDRPRRRTSTRLPRPRWRCSPANLPPGARRAGARSTASGSRRSERIVRRQPGTDPGVAMLGRRPSSRGLRRWWGADLPSGTVTLVLGGRERQPHECRGVGDTRSRVHTRRPLRLTRRRRAADAAFASRPGRLRRRPRARRPVRARVAAVTGEAERLGPGATGRVAAAALGSCGLAEPRTGLRSTTRPPGLDRSGFRRRSASPRCASARGPHACRAWLSIPPPRRDLPVPRSDGLPSGGR